MGEAGTTATGSKSLIAYRPGLDIGHPTGTELERSFQHAQAANGKLTEQQLLGAALWRTLHLANPLHLRGVIVTPELWELKILLLHCCLFVRDAGLLASVYGGVFLDMGLTIPYISVAAMRTALRETLHLSPVSKLLISSDARRTPGLY